MARENAETVRRWLEALSNEEFDAALELVHPDVELVPPGGQPPYKGAASLRRWMEPDAFQEQEVTPTDVIEVGEGRILASHDLKARGAGSGIELEGHSWSVWSFDDAGLITRLEIYLDRDEGLARKAAGLGG